MPQLTYEDQSALPALEGGLYDTGLNDVVSRTPGGNVKQVVTIDVNTVVEATGQVSTLTVDTAADADAFTILIGGFQFAGTSSGTDASVQATAIRALLNADAEFLAAGYTVGGAGADVVVTGPDGETFGTYEEVEATSAYSWALTTPAVVGTHFHLTVGGNTVHYAAQGTTAETESDAFLALILADANIVALVDAAEGTGTDITLTAKTAGVPFSWSFANENLAEQDGAGDVTASQTTANVTGSPIPFGRGLARTTTVNQAVLPTATAFVFEGISVNRAKGRPKDTSVSPPVTGDAVYNGDEAMPVLRKGRIWVLPETAVAIGDPVFLRHTQGANPLHTPGRFRNADVGAEVDQITQGARWITAASLGELAVLEVDVLAVVSS